MPHLRTFAGYALVAATVAALPAQPTQASDHREASMIREDATADIADLYAFVNPNNANKLVLVMTVNPFSVSSENVTYQFSPDVRYIFKVDIDGDARSDRYVIARFGQPDGADQQMLVWASGVGFTGGSTTPPTEEPVANDPIVNYGYFNMRTFAGQRDDPFFFDVVGFNRFLAGTGGFDGTDGFAGTNVSAIVVEVPMDRFLGAGVDTFSVWATTERREVTVRLSNLNVPEFSYGPWQQVDRVGNPAVNTALIPANLKNLYNIALPKNDATRFAPHIVASLQSLGTNQTNIDILASVAVPDTLKVDLNMPIEYPNGRALEDDVIDTLFFYIFNQTPTPDGVNANDKMFSNTFPYLAPPFQP